MTATMEHAGSPDLSDAFPTVAWRVRQWAEKSPNAVAMRDKDFGIWQERSWQILWEEVLTAAHGLLALGVEVGDVVSIQSEDRPEWIVLDLAAVEIRAVTTRL
jgi:long-chain acyl-CoA synthetase